MTKTTSPKNYVEFIKSTQANELYTQYKDLNAKALDMLTLKLHNSGFNNISSLIEFISARQKAKLKFEFGEKMYFDTDLVEQSTSQRISDYIAQKITKSIGHDKTVLDLTCGGGGNLISLAKYLKVIGNDIDKQTLEMAKLNSKVYSVYEKINFVSIDANEINSSSFDQEIDCIFIDPKRRESNSRTQSIAESSPNLFEIIESLKEISNHICIKVSPSIEYDEVAALDDNAVLEFISEDGVCKVALIWIGFENLSVRSATLLGNNNFLYQIQNIDPKPEIVIERAKRFILMPDPAIVRSHLVEEFANKFGLSKINKFSAFLTSDNIQDPKLFDNYEIIEISEHGNKTLKRFIKTHGIKAASIISKSFPVKAPDLEKLLKIKPSNEYFLIFTPNNEDKNFVYFCRRVSESIKIIQTIYIL